MEPGNLGIWDQEMKTLKIKICVAQNVGKVWASFEAIDPKPKNAQTNAFLLIFLVGQEALVTRVGVICWCHLTKHVSLVTIPA